MDKDKLPEVPPSEPAGYDVRRYLLYSLSIPERALRGSVGLVGGAVRESASLLVPSAFQNSKTYSVMVQQMLDFVVEDIGGVARTEEQAGPAPVENFVARKTVGNFVELAGLATLHISPMTVLAIMSDVAYGSQTLLREWGAELKRQGVIDENSTIDHADDLLDAVARASGEMAGAFDTPPLSVEGLKQTIDATRSSVAQIDPTKLIPREEIERMWTEMSEVARRDKVSLSEVSTTMALHSLNRVTNVGKGALSTVRVGGNLFDRHVVDHYRAALGDIYRDGVYATLAKRSGPYIDAVWQNFSSEKSTLTEDLVSGKLPMQAWNKVRRWFGGGGEGAGSAS